MLAVWSNHYRENWLQWRGLRGFTLWGCARLLGVISGDLVSPGELLHLAMATHAAGTPGRFGRTSFRRRASGAAATLAGTRRCTENQRATRMVWMRLPLPPARCRALNR
jgi:hypothetical protein